MAGTRLAFKQCSGYSIFRRGKSGLLTRLQLARSTKNSLLPYMFLKRVFFSIAKGDPDFF
jgi:hypothetical protein